MSCRVVSCRVMPCHVMSCHVMSCHVMSHYRTGYLFQICYSRTGSKLETPMTRICLFILDPPLGVDHYFSVQHRGHESLSINYKYTDNLMKTSGIKKKCQFYLNDTIYSPCFLSPAWYLFWYLLHHTPTL